MPDHGKSRPKDTNIPLDALKERYGNVDNLLKVYLDICKCLSGRCNEAAWAEYSVDDWRLFERVALGEGVAALMNSRKPELKTLLEQIPMDIWLNFSAMRMRIEHTNELRYKELSENVFPTVLPVFQPVIMLKGSVMALTLYEDISLRNMCDTDLLLSDENLKAVVDKLKKAGYNVFVEEKIYSGPVSSSVLEDKHLMIKNPAANGLIIELHWKLLKQYQQKGFDFNSWVFGQLVPIPDNRIFQNIPGLFMLKHTACLIHQILHVYFCHGTAVSGLFHFYETYFMAEKWNDLIDWDELSGILEKLGLTDILMFASHICEELFGKALPVESRLNSNRNAFILKLNSRPMKASTRQYLYVIKQLPLKQKMKFVFEAAFPSSSFMKKRYKDHKSKSISMLYIKRLSGGLSNLTKLIKTVLTSLS
jgi:hypothetical protein